MKFLKKFNGIVNESNIESRMDRDLLEDLFQEYEDKWGSRIDIKWLENTNHASHIQDRVQLNVILKNEYDPIKNGKKSPIKIWNFIIEEKVKLEDDIEKYIDRIERFGYKCTVMYFSMMFKIIIEKNESYKII